jgi:hypothetical protein
MKLALQELLTQVVAVVAVAVTIPVVKQVDQELY